MAAIGNTSCICNVFILRGYQISHKPIYFVYYCNEIIIIFPIVVIPFHHNNVKPFRVPEHMVYHWLSAQRYFENTQKYVFEIFVRE